MSLPVVVWVFEHSEEKLGNRLVLLTLAEFAHDDGSSAYPSATTIARRARLSERQVRYCLRSLEEHGAIVRDGMSDKRTVKYTVQMGAVSAGANIAGCNIAQPEGADSAPEPSTYPREPSETTSPQAPAEVVPLRPRNEVWDALTELFGKPGTRQKEIARGKVVGELRAAGVDRGEQVHRLADEYRRTFSEEVALTQHALGKHADQLAHAIRGRQAKRAVAAPCEFCGVGAGMHDADCVRPQAASA